LIVGCAAVIALAGYSTAYATGASKAKHKKPISVTIGFPFGFTGTSGYTATEVRQVLAVATNNINSQGKVHLTVVPEDTQSNPTVAVSVVQSLLPRVNGIVGIGLTQEGQAVQPEIKQSGKPTIFLADSDITGRNQRIFTMEPNFAGLMQSTLQYLKSKKVSKIGIIYDNQPTLASENTVLTGPAAAAAHISVSSDQEGTTTQTDFSSQITNVLSANPQAIVILTFPNQSGGIAAQLRSGGFKGILVGQQGDTNPLFYQVAGSTGASGYLVTAYWNPVVASGRGKTFLSQYELAYPSAPTPPDFTGIWTWDAIQIFCQAVEDAGSTNPAAIAKALDTKSFEAAIQPKLSFQSKGSDAGAAAESGYLLQYDGTGKLSILERLK
jgi:branched-chain amino acid transport system substrate-binding protein